MISAYPISKQPFGKFLRALFNRPLKPIICSSRAGMLDGLARAAESKKVRLPIAESFHRIDAIPLLTALERRLKLPGKALFTIHRADCAAIRWRCAQHARRRRRYLRCQRHP